MAFCLLPFLPHVLSCAVNEPLPIALLVKNISWGKKSTLNGCGLFAVSVADDVVVEVSMPNDVCGPSIDEIET